MRYGFTLIECLISLFILMIVAVAGVPLISQQYEHYRMTSTASELSQFISQARSEAVFHNKDLYIHVVSAATPSDTWELRLSDKDAGESDDDKNLQLIKGKGLVLIPDTNNGQKIHLYGRNGKASTGGNLTFSLPGKANKALQLKYSRVTGRLRICGEHGEAYGYDKC